MTKQAYHQAEPGTGVLFTNTSMIDDAINLARKNSIHYLLFGLACCGIELMQTGGPRADLDRFAAIFRASPRQADLMIVAGTLTYKMAVRTKLLYDQMAEPKYVLSMGSCSNCGGLFQLSYSVCKGVDKIIPVNVYVPGCPPRPEALTEGLLRIQDIMMCERWKTKMRPGRVDPNAPMMIGRAGGPSASPEPSVADLPGRVWEPSQGSQTGTSDKVK